MVLRVFKQAVNNYGDSLFFSQENEMLIFAEY
jgi:hypothetical protein